jgi:succinoglycan biosynthesis protein ExoO
VPTPFISVIMPAYNVAELLPRAVQSLQAQTYPNWHLHIIEDCATDNTLQVAQALALADNRITVHPQKHNSGPSAARNVGFEKATGEWVALLDADDAYHPTRLEVLLKTAEENQLDLVSDNLDIYDLAVNRTVGITWRNLMGKQPQVLTLETFLARTNPHNRFTYGLLKPMFRRSFLNQHNLKYDLRYRVGEDTLLHIHALRAGGREMLVGTPLYIYTLPRSVSSSQRSQFSHSTGSNTANHIRQATQELLDSNLPGLTPQVRALLRKRQLAYAQWEASRRVLSLLAKRRPVAAIKILLKHPAVLPLMVQLTTRRLRFRILAKLGLAIA